jgi:molybdopterin molybdotransferase
LGEPGDWLTPQRVALLAAGGADRVRVTPRPTLAIVLTGSELVPVNQHPADGEIRASNELLLQACACRSGFCVTHSTRVSDDLEQTRAALEEAVGVADVVITSGGVSVGDYDLVPRAVADLNGEVLLHKVAIKPGKPVFVARLGQTWVVGLPGNPVSALVGWRMFAGPICEALAGDDAALEDKPIVATLTEPARNKGGRALLLPGLLKTTDEGVQAKPLPWKGSHDLATAAAANALLLLPVGTELDAGKPVACYALDRACPTAPYSVTLNI